MAIVNFKKYNEKKQRIVVITNSGEPVTIAMSENGGKMHIFEVPVPKLERAKIIDTNAAGDSFVGGFLAQLVIFLEEQDSSSEAPQYLTMDQVTQSVKIGNIMAG
eukprot:CAMPEP_0168608368 /NCGR_PEP_ID=MMETSP0449_2-20121227/590_1 /TAXON_ID=1082188 /ORGANISM="Strombidium rassoulzadegani, Strain ras09" /LENGTH=104 /DNA_ID=CAMNT_0008648349 /DNA_START=355 /DNA_END=669 /DNA_ORIENTATION=-